jgi:hypothetical protein
MKMHRFALGISVLGFLGAFLLSGCDSSTSVDPPPAFVPLTETINLTPSWDSGSPIILEADGQTALLAFTSSYAGSGDIYLMELEDSDGDGLYDSFPDKLYFSTPSDSFVGPDADLFSEIGRYEFEDNGSGFPNYPGGAYYAGPRQLFYDGVSGRIFYTMGYEGVPQIASTTAPMFGDFDVSLDEVYNIGEPREPRWEYWYSKGEIPDLSSPGNFIFTFTGAYFASVSVPNSFGDQWLAYSDTLMIVGDRDHDRENGEDPVGAIETYAGLEDDGAPGFEGVDDDGDGFEDEFDLQVAAMSEAAPVDSSYAWFMQNYDPVSDDDEDGLMDEDPFDFIDNDGDGETDEDRQGDMNGDGSPGQAYGDIDGDGLSGFEDLEVRHAGLRVDRFLEYGYNPAADDDEDGMHDEDVNYLRDGIWVVKIGADGTPDENQIPVTLTNDGGRQPFFNPVNGDELLYTVDGDIISLSLVYEADSVSVAAEANLTDSGELESYPAYSDDGTLIVYVSSRHGSADLWIMNSDGSDPRRITNDPGQELLPRFTPGGDQIVFEAWRFPEGDRRVLITREPLP